MGEGAGWSPIARVQRGPSQAARCQPLLPHHRRPVVVNHQPFVADAFEEVRRQHPRLLRFVRLLGGNVFDTNDPGHVTGDLHHDFGQFELHRECVVENEDPGVSNGRPFRPERPAGMDAGHVFEVRPNLIHLGDVEAFKSLVELLIGLGDFFYSLFQHTTPQ